MREGLGGSNIGDGVLAGHGGLLQAVTADIG